MIMFIRMVAEKANEWGEEVWAASLDLEKAFDKVFHESVLTCLVDAGVDMEVVRYFWRLYRSQSAYVNDGGVRSRSFAIM